MHPAAPRPTNHWPARAVALARMARPATLPGGILAYVLGAAMGYEHLGAFDWGRAAAGLLLTEVTNLVASYADEYADVDTDSLARRTWFSGGSGVLPAGLAPPALARRAAVACAALALVLGLALIAAGVLPPAAGWIAGLGLLGGWFYSMPPLCLERHGLGEIDNAVIGGLLMPLMGYTVQTGRPALPAVVALLPIVAVVLANLLAVHWPDREADAAVGKRSLPVLLGSRTPWLYGALVALSYLFILAASGRLLPQPVAVAVGLTLPASVWAALAFGRRPTAVPGALAMAAVLAAAAAGWVLAAPR